MVLVLLEDAVQTVKLGKVGRQSGQDGGELRSGEKSAVAQQLRAVGIGEDQVGKRRNVVSADLLRLQVVVDAHGDDFLGDG